MTYSDNLWELLVSVSATDYCLFLLVGCVFYSVAKRLDLESWPMYATVALIIFLFVVQTVTGISLSHFVVKYAPALFSELWIASAVFVFTLFFNIRKKDAVVTAVAYAVCSFFISALVRQL